MTAPDATINTNNAGEDLWVPADSLSKDQEQIVLEHYDDSEFWSTFARARDFFFCTFLILLLLLVFRFRHSLVAESLPSHRHASMARLFDVPGRNDGA